MHPIVLVGVLQPLGKVGVIRTLRRESREKEKENAGNGQEDKVIISWVTWKRRHSERQSLGDVGWWWCWSNFPVQVRLQPFSFRLPLEREINGYGCLNRLTNYIFLIYSIYTVIKNIYLWSRRASSLCRIWERPKTLKEMGLFGIKWIYLHKYTYNVYKIIKIQRGAPHCGGYLLSASSIPTPNFSTFSHCVRLWYQTISMSLWCGLVPAPFRESGV